MRQKRHKFVPFFIDYKYLMSNQYLLQGFTLIDITPTGITFSHSENEFARNQQRNWETVQQIIGLRTQPTIISVESTVEDVSKFNFGINYTGKHKIWNFTFSVEYDGIYQRGSDKFGLVKYDFKITPVILGLTETAVPQSPLFYPSGPWNNIYFKAIS